MRLLPLLLLALGCPGSDSGDTSDSGSVGKDTGDTSDDTSGDTSETGETGQDPVLVAVELDEEALVLATSRDLPKLTATARWSDGGTQDVTGECAWTTGDPALAWVGQDGTVHGLGEGSTDATCTWTELADTATLQILDVAAAMAGEVVVNELLADPAVDADPNGDGTPEATEDEFVELVNVAAYTVDLQDSTLWDSNLETARHTFGGNNWLRPGEALVIFGGGTPNLSAERCFAYGVFNTDSGLQHGLALNNEGDTLTLRGATGDEITSVAVNPAVEDASIVLNPDLTGTSYTHHLYATGSVGAYSPCTRVDGTAFPTTAEWLGG